MDVQLEEEIYTNGCSQGEDRTIIWCYGNYGESGYNIYIYKKNEEIFNIYSSDWFQLISGVVVD